METVIDDGKKTRPDLQEETEFKESAVEPRLQPPGFYLDRLKFYGLHSPF